MPRSKLRFHGSAAGAALVIYLAVDCRVQGETLAPFVATPMEIVERMLEMAEVTKDDVVYDLGCGDGRMVTLAARKYGARGVGVDIDNKRVLESQQRVKKERVEGLVTIRKEDALKTDFSQATVVLLYLFPSANLKLRPDLRRLLKPGARVVSHDFSMGNWKPTAVKRIIARDRITHTLYLWKIDPLAVASAITLLLAGAVMDLEQLPGLPVADPGRLMSSGQAVQFSDLAGTGLKACLWTALAVLLPFLDRRIVERS